MVNVIGVRFRTGGKVYDFTPGELAIKQGMHVVVETARGVEYGEVVRPPHEVEELKVIQPLRPVMRIADEADDIKAKENAQKQKEAFFLCREKIRQHGLEMKLIDCEFTFDNSKILFYFTADGRIDFRELVKDLASVFRTRIELRQVGVRDETKLLGGLGVCGRTLCCQSYLNDFVPVSIKMAKEQNLSLNPTKISGVCGRLMCCLKNEEEVYEELNKKLPSVGDYVATADGLNGEVQSVSILKQRVRVIVWLPHDEKEVREYPAEELTVNGKRPRGGRGPRPQILPAGEQDAEGGAEAFAGQKRNSAGGRNAEAGAKGERTERPERTERNRDRRREGDKFRQRERSPREGTGREERGMQAENAEGRSAEPRANRQKRERMPGKAPQGQAGRTPEGQPEEGRSRDKRRGSEKFGQNGRRKNRGGKPRGEIQIITDEIQAPKKAEE